VATGTMQMAFDAVAGVTYRISVQGSSDSIAGDFTLTWGSAATPQPTDTATSALTPSASPTPTSNATVTPTPVASQTPTPSPTLTATPPVQSCIGDCNNSGTVTIDELVKGVNIALALQPISTCPSLNVNDQGTVTVDALIRAVNNALKGCP
jgi:hypothetical protein